MRTTLDIDDDVLSSAKEVAGSRKTTAGKVISDLARRRALTKSVARTGPEYRNGLRLMPPTEGVVTPEMIDRLLSLHDGHLMH